MQVGLDMGNLGITNADNVSTSNLTFSDNTVQTTAWVPTENVVAVYGNGYIQVVYNQNQTEYPIIELMVDTPITSGQVLSSQIDGTLSWVNSTPLASFALQFIAVFTNTVKTVITSDNYGIILSILQNNGVLTMYSGQPNLSWNLLSTQTTDTLTTTLDIVGIYVLPLQDTSYYSYILNSSYSIVGTCVWTINTSGIFSITTNYNVSTNAGSFSTLYPTMTWLIAPS